MRDYTIDFTGVKTYWYFYEVIKKGLETPDWCGENLDAIWDMLTGYIEAPKTIYVKGSNTLPTDLHREYKLLIETLYEASVFYKNHHFKVVVID